MANAGRTEKWQVGRKWEMTFLSSSHAVGWVGGLLVVLVVYSWIIL